MPECLSSMLSRLDDPSVVISVGWIFIASYYVASWFFLYYNRDANYQGAWKKNGWIDKITSVVWGLTAIFLTINLVIFLTGRQISLTLLLNFYVIFLFLFAFIYNLLDWHFEGSFNNMKSGWACELQCLIISAAAMTTASYPSAAPKSLAAETLSVIQSLLGVAFVAIFIARAVSVISPS